jgi:hypothetical protein
MGINYNKVSSRFSLLRAGIPFIIVVLFTSISLAFSQDFSLSATYGSISLNSGFTPDPYTIKLKSGGSINASSLGSGCGGNIANAPDFELTYTAGSLDLYISVISDSDTTLVINTPSGNWICDDDSGGDLDPSVRMEKPSSGVYDIWVGTYGSSTVNDATLYISELGRYGN